VKTGVNRFVPSITQTAVRLDGASLSPLSGSGTLTGLFVGNPSGWSGDKAFYIGKVHVKVVPSSIFSDCIVLSDVSIDGPDFVYETKVVSSNIGDLLKNIRDSSNNQGEKAQPVDKQGKPLRFVVKHFTLTNGRVTIGIGPTAITLPMPPVTLDNVGTREGGISSAELALAVMRGVTGGIVTATTNAAGKIGSTMGAAAGNSAKAAGEAIKGLFGGNK
jgi:Cu/Ag efflux protein CusF